jgi:hypothetical protein
MEVVLVDFEAVQQALKSIDNGLMIISLQLSVFFLISMLTRIFNKR